MERAHFREEREQIEVRIGSIREQLSYSSMLDLVRTIDAFVVSSASAAGVEAEKLPLVRDKALQDSFYICVLESKKSARHAAGDYYNYLSHHIGLFQNPAIAETPLTDLWQNSIDLASKDFDVANVQESFALFHLAVSSVISEQESANEGRQILRTLIAALALSFDELGRMFRVAGETVRRWETGASSISSDRKATITSTRESLNKLLKIFRQARLPQVIRRPAELFSGECALDWILRGKIVDVVKPYEISLRFQA